MCSAYLGILIAGAGEIIRMFIVPDNFILGGIVSAIVASIVIPFIIIYIRKYKK